MTRKEPDPNRIIPSEYLHPLTEVEDGGDYNLHGRLSRTLYTALFHQEQVIRMMSEVGLGASICFVNPTLNLPELLRKAKQDKKNFFYVVQLAVDGFEKGSQIMQLEQTLTNSPE